jgi:excisionase family DNA binding protein
MTTTPLAPTRAIEPDPQLLALSRKEVAQRLGISISLCRKLLKQGDIPSLRAGKRVLVPLSSVRKFLERVG